MAALRAQTADLRKSVKKAEQKMELLVKKRDELVKRLSNPEIYEGSTSKLMEFQVRLGDIKNEIASTEEHWLKISSELENSN